MEDVVYGSMHRMLHIPFLYKHIHKVHHTWTTAVSICALYCHPIEHVLGNMVPLTIPALILGKRLHFTTLVWITSRRVIGATIAHSGYNFPYEPAEMFPFKTFAAYHDFHHGNNINNNMGSGTILTDFVMGVNKDYFEHVYKQWNTPVIPEKKGLVDGKKDKPTSDVRA